MDFERIDSAGSFEIEITGDLLDLYWLSIFNLSLQAIIDRVAYDLLAQRGIVDSTWRRFEYLPYPYAIRPPFVRIEVVRADAGSYIEELKFAIAVVLADPNTVAVLQNLSAELIWAIAQSGVRGIRARLLPPKPESQETHRPFEIGPNMRDALTALANSGGISEVKFRHRSPDKETTEVTISIKKEQSRE